MVVREGGGLEDGGIERSTLEWSGVEVGIVDG